jgi:hypothetical protein
MVEGWLSLNHLKAMPRQSKQKPPTRLIREWPLAPSATLGSSVRANGILLEVRARLPSAVKKLVDVEANTLVLRVPEDDYDNHEILAANISLLIATEN